jgi:hypothetical protein
MCDALVWSFDALTGLPWLEILKTTAAIAAAGIALSALRNWKRQDRAKRHADFLDQLIDAVHDYMSLMNRPVTLGGFVKIGMKAHEPTWLGGDQRVAGAIEYIKKRGQEDSKRLLEALERCRSATVRIQALVAKGQVFRFEDYVQCQNAAKMLTWQFDRLEALGAAIASSTWNWENPEVLGWLEKVMTIEQEDLQTHLTVHNVAILEFAARTYERTYK